MKLFLVTPAAGKRLIGKAALEHPAVKHALESGTAVIVAGTTNGYVAGEILSSLGQDRDFELRRFFRGVTLPPAKPLSDTGRLPDETAFPGDVVIQNGAWQKGKTIFDVVDSLKPGDVILKGANALDLERKQAAVLIGHPQAGTIGAALRAVYGRRVRLVLPVGLEKRVCGDLARLAGIVNHTDAYGFRLWPVQGDILTEIEALELLTGATADLVAAGGVGGAEGGVWLAVRGNEAQMAVAETVLKSVENEPAFSF